VINLKPERRSVMKLRHLILIATVFVFSLSVISPAMAAKGFPKKPITIICPWSAGGGTDRTARFVAGKLHEILGVPVNVVNKTGGGGAIGFTAGANAKPDGYTITNLTFEIGTLKWLGYSDIGPEAFKPLMQFNEDASAVIVGKDSKYNTVKELLDDIKAEPAGTFQFSGCAIGTVWDLARIGMMHSYGIDFNKVKFIPTKGAAPAITELLGGHVDVITCSYPEAAPQIDAGSLKALAIMADERNPQFSTVPTLKEQGIDWSYGTWRGFAVPKKTPDDVANVLIKALKQVFSSDDFVSFMNKNGFGIKIRDSKEFGEFMEAQHKGLEGIITLAGYGKKK
jgi:tripartite-type tricarboxylate transporter receptor subunit TctC